MTQGYLRSMTACGRGEATCPQGRFICELQSVNRRHLDLQFYLPKAYLAYETSLRQALQTRLGRGHVTCTLSWEPSASAVVELEPNLTYVQSLERAWKKIASKSSVPEAMPVAFLLSHSDRIFGSSVAQPQENDMSIYALEACQKACDHLQTMKLHEGSTLIAEFSGYLEVLGHALDKIQIFAPEASAAYRSKLLERLHAVLDHPQLDQDERILKEIALFAERIDLSEEISRAYGHIAHFQQWLTTPFTEERHVKGKMGEFLLQEMQREVNTLGSKASQLEVTRQVLEMKAILEKMREQMQNIE